MVHISRGAKHRPTLRIAAMREACTATTASFLVLPRAAVYAGHSRRANGASFARPDQPQDFARWLSGGAGTELLKPAPDDYLQVWPVSRRVNSSRAPNDDPTESRARWAKMTTVRARQGQRLQAETGTCVLSFRITRHDVC